MGKLFSTIITHLKENKKIIFFLIVGFILFFAYSVLWYYSKITVSPWIRSLQYISIITILITFYIYLLKYKRLILSNIVLLFLLITILEISLFFVLGMPAAKRKYFQLPSLPENHIDANVGVYLSPDSIYHSVLYVEDTVVFDVHYSIDSFYKRITPDPDNSKKKYALFFGCSIAFGEGLEDNQTFPYYFQKNSAEFNSYNFATSGHGTNHMLAKLQFQDLSDQVKEQDGIAVYVFFWDHIYRAIGSMARYTDWLQTAPYYYIKDGKLVRNKLFKNGRYFTSKFYEIIHQSNIVKYFKIDFPAKLNNSHFDVVTEMILESKREYAKQFGNENFYLVFYPAYRAYTDEEFATFKKYLTEKNIDFIDLNEDLIYAPEHTLGGDPHPNAKTHDYLSRILYEKINGFENARK